MDGEKLINLVQKYECLYDLSSPHYNDKLRKIKAWDIISKEMGISVTVCKMSWKKIRDNYRKALKGRNEKLSAGRRCRRIKFEKELEFIQPFFTPREEQQQSNVDSDSETEDSQSSNHNHDGSQKTLEILERYIKKEMESKKHPIDIFFSSMAASAKKLSLRNQAQIKRDVLKIVSDAEINEHYELTMQRAASQFNNVEEYVPTRITTETEVPVEDDSLLCEYKTSPKHNDEYYTEED